MDLKLYIAIYDDGRYQWIDAENYDMALDHVTYPDKLKRLE